MFDVTIGGTIVPATGVKVEKRLNDWWLAEFSLANSAEYRDIIGATVKDVEIRLLGTLLFDGSLVTPTLGTDKISCGCVAKGHYYLGRRKFSGTYNGIAVNTIAGDICTAMDLTWSSNITYLRNLRFDRASGLYAVMILVMHCGLSATVSAPLDWWTDGLNLYIGQKGSSKGSVDLADIGSKQTDYSKVMSKVTSRAYSYDDQYELLWSEGSGTEEHIFDDRNIYVSGHTPPLTQKQITYRRYLSMTEPIVRIPVKIDPVTWVDKGLDVGDSITVKDAEMLLDGTYRITKAILTEDYVDVCLIKPEMSLADEMLPLQQADTQAKPAPTNLPPVIATSLGAGTTSPGGQTVGVSGSNSSDYTLSHNTWVDTVYFTIPDVDHDMYVIHANVTPKTTKASNFAIQCRVKLTKTGQTTEYYPLQSDYDVPYCYFIGSYPSPGVYFFTIPKNRKGWTATLQVYYSRTASDTMDASCTITGWGHSPHTHPAYVSPSDHQHSITEALHENIQTDRREALREVL